MDKIIIKGLKLFAYHGLRQEEQQNGQTFILDITLYLPLDMACRSDNIEKTVNYSMVTKVVIKVFCENRFGLIERAADAVADAILLEFLQVKSVTVCVKKPEAPVKADFDYMAVEITRSMEGDL